MPDHESHTLKHALEVLRGMVDSEHPRPLSPCEKLACRVLLPRVGKRTLVTFCETFEAGNPLYRKSHLALSLRAIERDLRLAV